MVPAIVIPFVVLCSFLVQRVSAFWVLAHNTLTIDRLDPIVTPGKVSGHVHNIIGASNFGPTVDAQNLLASNCTTSPVQDDMSNYWAPQLYHKNADNGTLSLVPIQYVQTYYKQHAGTKNTTVSAFPAGLRMLAGNPYRTSFNESNSEDKAINFVCLDFTGGSSDSYEFPKTNCKNGMRAQVVFPSCWDGKNVDSSDHKSHMSYPIGSNPDSGDCPDTHPTKVILLFHEWIFDVDKFEFRNGEKNWVFSFGDEVGYGFHADFINGWKQDVLEAATKECTGDLFNNVEGCPPFTSSIKRDVASSCKIDSVVDEDVGKDQPIKELPGCNPIPVTQNATCSNSTTPSIKGDSGTNTTNTGTTTGTGTTGSTTDGSTTTTSPSGTASTTSSTGTTTGTTATAAPTTSGDVETVSTTVYTTVTARSRRPVPSRLYHSRLHRAVH